MVALGSNAVAQSGGAGGGGGAAGGAAGGTSGSVGGTTAAGGTAVGGTTATTGGTTTQGALSAPGAQSGALSGQQPGTAVSNPTADGAISGGVPATPAPGGINQRVTVGNTPGALPTVGNTPGAFPQVGAQPGSPVGGLNNTGLNPTTLPQAQPNVGIGGAASGNPVGGVPDFPGNPGAPGVAQGMALTPAQTQQMQLLTVQLNALRGTGGTAQAVPTIEAGLRQMAGQNAQLPAGALTRLSTGLANAWQNSNLTVTQQQQILSSVVGVLSAQGNPAASQQALVVARQQLRASGLPNTTVMALNNELQQLLVAQRSQGRAAGGQTGNAAGTTGGALGTGAGANPLNNSATGQNR